MSRHLDAMDMAEQLDSVREALIRADSITSLVFYRHRAALPDDVLAELRAVSVECRAWAARLPEVD